MFDIGFSELVLLGVVALLVLGPERLPAAARTAGALLRRARNSYQSLKSDIERELAADEFKKSAQSIQEPLQSIKESIGDIGRGAAEIKDDLQRRDEPAATPKSAEVTPAPNDGDKMQ